LETLGAPECDCDQGRLRQHRQGQPSDLLVFMSDLIAAKLQFEFGRRA